MNQIRQVAESALASATPSVGVLFSVLQRMRKMLAVLEKYGMTSIGYSGQLVQSLTSGLTVTRRMQVAFGRELAVFGSPVMNPLA